MEKLMEHTLQRQLAEQSAKVDALQAQMAKMTALLECQLSHLPAPQQITTSIKHSDRVNNSPVTNNTTTNHAQHMTNIQQTNNIIQIVPWDGGRRISVNVDQIAAAFTENPRLKEYARLGDHELTDPDIAPPYVTELLMDLVKRAHANPSSRNVYLNPRRADQALVHMRAGRWEVVPLEEATRLLFDGVATTIHRVTMTYAELKQLPLEAQNALSMAGMLYEDEPTEYARRAKAPMSAHLTNMQGGPVVVLEQ